MSGKFFSGRFAPNAISCLQLSETRNAPRQVRIGCIEPKQQELANLRKRCNFALDFYETTGETHGKQQAYYSKTPDVPGLFFFSFWSTRNWKNNMAQ